MTMNIGLFDRIMRLSAGLGFVYLITFQVQLGSIIFDGWSVERTNLRFRMVSLLWINGC